MSGIAILVVIGVLDLALFAGTVRWALTAGSWLPEDVRVRRRLRSFYGWVVEALGLVLIGAVLALVWSAGFWVLACTAVVIGGVGALLLHEERGNPWYLGYQRDRIMDGLSPRAWWDPRLGHGT